MPAYFIVAAGRRFCCARVKGEGPKSSEGVKGEGAKSSEGVKGE